MKQRIPEGGLIAKIESLVELAKEEPFWNTIFRSRPNEATALVDRRVMQRVAIGISGKLQDWPAEVCRKA